MMMSLTRGGYTIDMFLLPDAYNQHYHREHDYREHHPAIIPPRVIFRAC